MKNKLFSQLFTHWHNLKEREKYYVAMGGTILTLFFSYTFIVSPLNSAVDTLETQVSYQLTLAQWMMPRVQALQGVQSGITPAQSISSDSLLSTVNTQLLQTGWAGTAPALKQSADNSVQVTLSGVPFDALSTWLTGLWQQFGITVSQMNVQKTSSVGMVNVTLTLKTS